jgi:20S proteasome alpha/beta subunit
MTTIAVSRSEMACDSRSSYDNGEWYLCDDKIIRLADELIGCSGEVADIFKFLAWYRSTGELERPELKDMEAVVLNADGLFHYSSSTYGSRICQPFFAIGSGSMAANAAMLCGKTPAKAVEIACALDKNSGGPVRNYKLRGRK